MPITSGASSADGASSPGSGSHRPARFGNPSSHFEWRAGHIALDAHPYFGDPDPMESGRVILEAIVRRRNLGAAHYRGTVVLAPHILLTRNAALSVDAVTLDRDGAPPPEARLGTFKPAGLGQPVLTDPMFRPAADRDAGVTLLAV